MTGLVTLVTGFLFERTTFIIIISQTGIGTLISRLFRGWGTLFQRLSEGLGFLLGLDLDNRSPGFDSLLPGDVQHPCKIAQ